MQINRETCNVETQTFEELPTDEILKERKESFSFRVFNEGEDAPSFADHEYFVGRRNSVSNSKEDSDKLKFFPKKTE